MRFLIFSLFFSVAACGQSDFETFHHASAEPSSAREGVTTLGGSPSLVEAQSAFQNGVVVRITNAVEYPDGADSEPTRCHLSARLCARPPMPEPGNANDITGASTAPAATTKYPDSSVCIDFGIVNAGVSRTFYVEPTRLEQALKWPEREAVVELQSSCQVTSLHYPATPSMRVSPLIDAHLQCFDFVIARAHWAGYGANMTESLSE